MYLNANTLFFTVIYIFFPCISFADTEYKLQEGHVTISFVDGEVIDFENKIQLVTATLNLNSKKSILIDKYYPDAGGYLEALQPILINVDDDSAKELVIITRENIHTDESLKQEGYFYGIHIYDHIYEGKPVQLNNKNDLFKNFLLDGRFGMEKGQSPLVNNKGEVNVLFIKEILNQSPSALNGYFDLDNKLDSLVTHYSNNELNACITTSKLKTKSCFIVSAENEDPNGLSFGLDVYNGLKGEIITDEHCCGIDKRFYIKFYRYSPKINNWLLYKKVDYGAVLDESYNYTNKYIERKYYTSSQVDLLGKEHKDSLVKEYEKEDIETRIKYLLDIKIKNTRLTFFEVNEWFFLLPLSKDNLSNYNDIAYYLQKQENHKLAIYILVKILSKFPNRVVAYLNIADSQMTMELEEDALKNYKKYLKLMKQKGKLKKVPKRVLKYLNNSDLDEQSPSSEEPAPQTKVETPEPAVVKTEPKPSTPKDTEATIAKEETTKTKSGSSSFPLLVSLLGLLAWRAST